MEMMTYVVSYGNIFDGIRLVGPFSTFEAAFEFADGSDGPWEIAELEPPLSYGMVEEFHEIVSKGITVMDHEVEVVGC